MNPFDLKAALLAKHAQHVVVIHFPIGLFITSFIFDLLGRWKRDPRFPIAAYYNLVAAAIMAVVAAGTGLIAWRWLLEGQRLRGALKLHLILGLASTSLIWLVTVWRGKLHKKPEERLPTSYLLGALLASAVIALTGHVGGILSGVEGPPG